VKGPDPYYRPDLALVHHRGFGFHAEACAPGILRVLEPVAARRGVVLELGCGSGLLTRELVEAGHRVVATDASAAMLDLARAEVPGAEVRQLVLPDDPLPQVDAVVSVGHVLSYLPDRDALERALVAVAGALRPQGILAIDLCDLEWGTARRQLLDSGRAGDDWAIVTRYSMPTDDCYVRDMTTFLPNGDGTWRRDDEHHETVLVDTETVPALLAAHGVDAMVGRSFGGEVLPVGLRTIVGHRR
jgi:SAM-dependent methyltransferase